MQYYENAKMWQYGNVAMWQCGNVAMWQSNNRRGGQGVTSIHKHKHKHKHVKHVKHMIQTITYLIQEQYEQKSN